MTDSDDDPVVDSTPEAAGDADPTRTPSVTCSRCDRTWSLAYELDDVQAGNRALEQFALDHYRHTGHYPDDVTPWIADCRQCPADDRFLSETPARRWARTHARHTRHTVALREPAVEESESIEPPSDR